MAIDPAFNTGSQLSRALAAYLTGIPIANVFSDMGVATFLYPNTQVKAHSFTMDPNTGYEMWQVSIQMRQTASDNPNTGNQDGDTWVSLNALIGLVRAAIFQSTSGTPLDISKTMAGLITAAGNALATSGSAQAQANNADMAQFSCLQFYFRGGQRGESEEEGADWVEILNVECHCVPWVVN